MRAAVDQHLHQPRGPRRGYRPAGWTAARRAVPPVLRWAPLPLLAAGLALPRPALAQPAASAPTTSARPASAPRAARALARGEALAAADIDAAPGDTLAPRLVGWTTRRVIAAGEVLRAPAVVPPAAVRAGDAVAVVWRQGGVALRLAGTAAADAALGARVAVRVDARRRLEGTVAAPGVVTLP
ncbi:hypothetical protein tb265_17440 [Gemmatimonadetes bacterium T265]|nr:hypothetical protein tb265_17440 [Gemmatimonadetes bacterium T265]